MNITEGHTVVDIVTGIAQEHPEIAISTGVIAAAIYVFRNQILSRLIDPIPTEAKKEATNIIRGQSDTASLLRRYTSESFTWTFAITYIVQKYLNKKLSITLDDDIHKKLLARYKREIAVLRKNQLTRMRLYGTINGLR